MNFQAIRDAIRILMSLLPRPHKKVTHTTRKTRGRKWAPLFGIDFAWGLPSIGAMRAVGVKFVCCYISHDASKNITKRSSRYFRRYGLGIVTVFETTADRALAGHDAGKADAQYCNEYLRAIGAKDTQPIYFAVDFDETGGQAGAVLAYMRGAASVLGHGRTGAYGGYWTIKRLFDAGAIRYGWQTYAWSGTLWDFRAQLRQFSNGHNVGGVDCDFDRAMAPDYGQWR